jgi:hypothetical protein
MTFRPKNSHVVQQPQPIEEPSEQFDDEIETEIVAPMPKPIQKVPRAAAKEIIIEQSTKPKAQKVAPVEQPQETVWELNEVPTQTALVIVNTQTGEQLGVQESLVRILNILAKFERMSEDE